MMIVNIHDLDTSVAYVWSCDEAVVKRKPVLAVHLCTAGKCSRNEVVDGVCGDLRESLLHLQQQMLNDHSVSARH